ncbi:MAG: CaiB/BaiF CoA-transferase family protein [Halobacteriales archaeon]|nr:CaiB/BaiF CoA-transferase family protein [Halobacteriales archaeon]
MTKPLEGITVADFSQMMQGPWGTMTLGDLGADVIKIEPVGGELERGVTAGGELWRGKSAYYLAMNRNKRSVAVDLKDDRGAQVARDIVGEADVLVENFRPGVMDRLGFGYEDVTEYNPEIIYASASGYGADGPYAERPGQDILIQSMSGVASLAGRGDGRPTPAGTYVADELSALYITLHVVTALFHRDRTGQGQKIEANLLNAMIAGMCQEVTATLNMDIDFERPNSGIGHPMFGAPYGIYETADGHVAISIGDLGDIGEALAIDGLADLADPEEAFAHRDEIHGRIEAVTQEMATEEVVEVLLDAGAWVGPVNDLESMAMDPQVDHNNMIIEVEDPDVGAFKTTGFPVSMSETPPSVERPPPRTGEHAEEVLSELGYDDQTVTELRADGVLGGEAPSE